MTVLEKIKELRKLNKYRKFLIYVVYDKCYEIKFKGNSDTALQLARFRSWGQLTVTKVFTGDLDYWVLEVEN